MKNDELEKWETEITIAERFREQEFGTYDKDSKSRVGFNIEYFEKGYAGLSSNNISEIIPEWVITHPPPRASSSIMICGNGIISFAYSPLQME